MFRKILIANRGEIACRIAHTARRLGIRTVAVHSDVDRHAAHVLACDEAVSLGGDSAASSYLRWDAILEAARRTGAQAVHPGYGFLSENEDFARACVDAGLVFIGPPPEAIAAMGSKAAAKALMEKAGVPLVPGYHGVNNDPALLAAEAERIGYPVLIKASAGGGGRGMRRVDRAEDFAAALDACQREARNAFGNDHVLVERYVTRPRHIEIQVFADSKGQVVHLFERDCSVQRRHQKVLEESPAPGLSPERRAAMGLAAVEAAHAVGYVGAGTVEFIAEPTDDGDLRFYFMEMNTRLQVEHPVTEAVTGQDLVEWQLRVAAGQPLPLRQDQLRQHGHAIEARLCAENPDAGFLPATGTLHVVNWPEHVRFARNADGNPEHPPAPVRVDTGFGEGDTISPHYDSMVAKLIVWGETREQALARLDVALGQTHLDGLATNADFLRRVVRSPAFSHADLDTALIERERASLFPDTAPVSERIALAAATVAQIVAEEEAPPSASGQAPAWTDPWQRRDAFRVQGLSRRTFDFQWGGERHTAVLERLHDGARRLRLSNMSDLSKLLNWTVLPAASSLPTRSSHGGGSSSISLMLELGAERTTVHVNRWPGHTVVHTDTGSAELLAVDALTQVDDDAGAAGQLTAPMPGKLIAWKVAPGEDVKAGQPLAVMEAMKMEHTLTAPRDGRVELCLYAVGDQVAEGQPVLRLAEVD